MTWETKTTGWRTAAYAKDPGGPCSDERNLDFNAPLFDEYLSLSCPDDDIENGNVKRFASIDELIDSLRN